MDHYREMSSAFFTRLTGGLGRKRRPTTALLSESLGPPASQTSLSIVSLYQVLGSSINPSHSTYAVFVLPDELILYILSHISPVPRDAGQYSRFRLQYCMGIDDYHQQRLQFLLPLSMTCRAMRVRLLPWVWERIECLEPPPLWGSGPIRSRKRNTITGALRADTSLATIVRYFRTLLCPWFGA